MIPVKLPQHLITLPHVLVLGAHYLNIGVSFALAPALTVPFKSSKAEWASRIDSLRQALSSTFHIWYKRQSISLLWNENHETASGAERARLWGIMGLFVSLELED